MCDLLRPFYDLSVTVKRFLAVTLGDVKAAQLGVQEDALTSGSKVLSEETDDFAHRARQLGERWKIGLPLRISGSPSAM